MVQFFARYLFSMSAVVFLKENFNSKIHGKQLALREAIGFKFVQRNGCNFQTRNLAKIKFNDRRANAASFAKSVYKLFMVHVTIIESSTFKKYCFVEAVGSHKTMI